jgi:ATP-dependent RNA helicase DeaD
LSENITFRDFALNEDIQRGLADMGYERPTPVQAAAIPEVIKGKDLLVQAKTGSGKTLGFGLGVLQRIDPTNHDVQVLVIVPTRELAIQVAEELSRAGAHMRLMVGAIYGGTKMDTQYTDLEWSQIIVGTPGRLRDHLTRGNLRLSTCRMVILDEADEMLDMGFKDDLEFLLAALPKERQSLLFSATFPGPIEAIARRYMKNPEKISVSTGLTTPVDIKHRFIKTTEPQKIDTLIKLLKLENPHLGIIFCKRKTETTLIARKLKQAGLQATFINGDMNQAQRIAALDAFKKGEVNLLVATDVAARGLDISGITHVINLQVPDNTETYVHRSGRTGRAGKKGTAITLVTPIEERDFIRIQRDLREGMQKNAAPAPRPEAPAAEPAARPAAPRSPERPPVSERPARERRPSERVAPERTAPERTASERPAPERVAPERVAPERGTPERVAPARSVAAPSQERPASRPESRQASNGHLPRSAEASRPRSLTTQEVLRWGANRQSYLAMAEELLRQGHPEQIIASLLSLVPQAQGFLPPSAQPQEESKIQKGDDREDRNSRRRRTPERSRTQRKPSQVVYSE